MVMKINKINYEQFAIDYLEGNLTGEDLKEMKTFLQKNPEVKAELDEMQLFYLEPEDNLVFEGKEALLQEITSTKPKVISLTNRIWIAGVAAMLLIAFCTFIITNKIEPTLEKNYAEEPVQFQKNEPQIDINTTIEKHEIVEENNTKNKLENNQLNNVATKQSRIPTIKKNNKERTIHPSEYVNTNLKKNNPTRINVDEIDLLEEVVNNQPIKSNPTTKKNKTNAPNTAIEKNQNATTNQVVARIDKTQRPNLPEALIPSTIPALDIQIVEEIKNIDQIASIDLVQKESRLEQWGLLPEGSTKRKFKLANFKKSLLPEFASK